MQAYDRIGPHFGGVKDQEFKSLLARLFAHFGISGDVATYNVIESPKESLCDGRGSHNNASCDTLVLFDPVAFDRQRGRDRNVRVVDSVSPVCINLNPCAVGGTEHLAT